MTTDTHQAVLLTEAIDALNVKPGYWYLDGTFGRGGHTAEIMRRGGQVIALDYDEQAIAAGHIRFATEIANGTLILIRENFAHFEQSCRQLPPSLQLIAGALLDFGTSIEQLRYDQRGLSFLDPSLPLDMRLDARLGVTAADLLMVLPEKQLAELFWQAGGEIKAKAIAKAITTAKKAGKIFRTTGDLIEVIQRVSPRQQGHLHPATKVFQALRIAVNDELTNIQEGVPAIFARLQPEARLVTIAFHEGEDRIVKQLFKSWESTGLGEILTKKPITPTQEEIDRNSRSRSAKLRVIKKNHAN